MKILFKTTAANLTTTCIQEVLRAYMAKIEGNFYTFDMLAPLFKKCLTAYDSGADAACIYNVWLDFDVEIQAIADGASTNIAIEYLEQNREVAYRNFNSAIVNEMQKGKGYTIPFTADAVTDCNPTPSVFPVIGKGSTETYDNTPFTSGYYGYIATEKQQNRNGQSFTGLIFDIVPSALKNNAIVSANKKMSLNAILTA